MHKEYKVWIEIEEYDDEAGDGVDLDSPGAAVHTFGSYKDAYCFAEVLQVVAKRTRDLYLEAMLQLAQHSEDEGVVESRSQNSDGPSPAAWQYARACMVRLAKKVF